VIDADGDTSGHGKGGYENGMDMNNTNKMRKMEPMSLEHVGAVFEQAYNSEKIHSSSFVKIKTLP
jgi:hypothetical protein